jgi:transcriptional regulator with GAF, ATPase, and Fis domain
MNSETATSVTETARRYEAVMRVSEALSACRDPQDLAKVIADELEGFLSFDHLDLMVLKEESLEIDWMAPGRGTLPLPLEAVQEFSNEELTGWHVFNTQEALYIPDWATEERFPRLKRLLVNAGVSLGAAVRVPLTTPHRRLGTLGPDRRFKPRIDARP